MSIHHKEDRKAKPSSEFPQVVVGVLVRDLKGQILLAKIPKWKNRWAVVGGKVEYGESLENCAVREVREETGLQISELRFLQVQESIFPVEFFETRHFVFVNYTAVTQGGQIHTNEELSECLWVIPEEALKMELNESTRKLVSFFLESQKFNSWQ